MAYQKQHHRVLAGGLALVPPGDKINPADSLLLTNFRVDQAGELRSRKGVNTLVSWGDRIHTLYRRHPSTRYAAFAGSLVRGAAAPDTEIATGFDGQPLGIVSAGKFAWIMNRAQQLKDPVDLTTPLPIWTPAAPTTAPTVDGDVVETAVVGSFDQDETWLVVGPDATEYTPTFPHTYPAGFDDANAKLGDSLHIECNPPGVWEARRDYSGATDLGISGQQRDDDEFHFWMYASDPAAIDEIVVAIDVNGGDFSSDYYTVTLPASILQPSRFSWTFVRIRRRTIGDMVVENNTQYIEALRQSREARDAGDEQRAIMLEQQMAELRELLLVRTPGFTRMGSTEGKDWSTAEAVRFQVRVNESCDVHFDQAEFFGGVNANMSGTYQWFVTFDTDDGHESNPSPASAELTLDKRAAALTGLPVSLDPQVTRKHIYRAGGSLGKAWRVLTVDNGVDNVVDNISDEQTQVIATEMEEDHDPAPACSFAIGAYGRILAFSSEEFPSRFWWTPVGRHWYFPGASADENEAANWIDAGEDGDNILAATHRGNTVNIYKNRTIWRLPGDPDAFDPELTNSTKGTVGRKSVANAGTVDYFVATDGLYRFNGSFEELVFPKIAPIFRNEHVVLTEDGIRIAPVDDTNRAECVLEFSGNRLFFSYPEVGHATPTCTLICDLLTGNVMMHRLNETFSGGNQGFSALHNEGHQRDLIGSVFDGGQSYIVEVDQDTDDDGTPIFVQWLSGYQDMGLPDNEKTLGEIVIDYQTAIDDEIGDGDSLDALTVKLYYDNGQEVDLIGSIFSETRTKAYFRIGEDGEGRKITNAAILIEGEMLHTAVIYAVYFHWYAEDREGLSFDSGVTDSGSELLKQMVELEFEVEGAEDISWRLYSDMPANVMTYRMGGTISFLAGERTKRVLLASPVDGFRHRLTVTSDGPFRRRTIRWRIRRVGEFVDGVAGDNWTSFELPMGNGGIDEFKEVVVYYQAASGASLQVLTDLPGGVMTVRQTVTLPAASGYRSYRFPLDLAPVEGAAIAFKLTSAGPAYLYGGWVRTRTLGLYIDGSKGERWISQVLDAGDHQYPKLYREVEWDISFTGQFEQDFTTEQPGGALAVRQNDELNVSGTLTRRPVEVNLGGNTKGKLFQITLYGAGQARVYRGRVLVKDLGTSAPTGWRWVSLPIPPTPDDYPNRYPFPIRPTDIEPVWVTLPMDAIE